MINNIQFKIIAGKINKIFEFYTIFARKMPDYMMKQRDRGQAEGKCLRLRPKFWPQGHFGLEDLTSLDKTCSGWCLEAVIGYMHPSLSLSSLTFVGQHVIKIIIIVRITFV